MIGSVKGTGVFRLVRGADVMGLAGGAGDVGEGVKPSVMGLPGGACETGIGVGVTGSTSSTGFITIRRETRPHDPNQIMEECAYCQGPPHSPTDCPTIIQGAGPLAS